MTPSTLRSFVVQIHKTPLGADPLRAQYPILNKLTAHFARKIYDIAFKTLTNFSFPHQEACDSSTLEFLGRDVSASLTDAAKVCIKRRYIG